VIRKHCIGVSIAAAATLWSGASYADHLHLSADAAFWARFGAAALLVVHIGGGSLGIISGAAALAFRKGSARHRAAGKVFFVSMLVSYTVATCVAPFLNTGQRTNTTAGILALYLLLTGWTAARQRDSCAGAPEYLGVVAALLIICASLLFVRTGAKDAGIFILFAVVGAVAAAGDVNVILRGTISRVGRLSRHLWRMCFSLFIASGSFFLGQQRIMPHWIRGSPILTACALAPLAAMIFWIVWVRLPRKRKQTLSSPQTAIG